MTAQENSPEEYRESQTLIPVLIFFFWFDLNYLTCLRFDFSVWEMCLMVCDVVSFIRECCEDKGRTAVPM